MISDQSVGAPLISRVAIWSGHDLVAQSPACSSLSLASTDTLIVFSIILVKTLLGSRGLHSHGTSAGIFELLSVDGGGKILIQYVHGKWEKEITCGLL